MEALNIASKASRKRAISVVEHKVMETLSRRNAQVIQPPPEEEEVLEYHEEVGLIDGEVDEGDLHVKVTSRRSLTEVSHSYLVSSGFLLRCMNCNCLEYFEIIKKALLRAM